jgi:triphosphoribosyl-dephospho-CoA synthase
MNTLIAKAIAPASVPELAPDRRRLTADIGRLAVRSLYDELALYPKPGLVSPVDNGSHEDMSAQTFMRSMFALRHYFVAIAQAGSEGAGFEELKRLGIEAEQAMLAATGGINTHRGAIFALGLLCAAAGHCLAHDVRMTPEALRAVLLIEWGEALGAHAQITDSGSHGAQAAALHAASGAREEAALGLPSVFEIALPVLHRTLAARRGRECARIDALFALMAHISDSNVYYRRGREGAALVTHCARRFLERGGTAHAEWRRRAIACHRLFVRHRLSPGGAADLLAVTCFVHEATRRFGPAS